MAYFELMCRGCSNQPRKVWRELNRVLGRKAQTRTPHLSTSSVTIESPQVITSMLNSYFITPVSSPSPDLIPPTVHPADTVFRFRPVDEEEVMQALRGLNPSKAMGVDGVSFLLLKTVADVIAPSITKLFNGNITSGQFPDEWKKVTVTPVPMSSSAKLPSDFRPISVLPVIAKLFESLVHCPHSYLSSNSLLHPNQFGFRPRHSTQGALFRLWMTGDLHWTRENVWEQSL